MTESIAVAATSERVRESVAEGLRQLTKVALAGVIVLSPFRARMVLEHRHVGTIYGDYTNLIVFWSDIALVGLLALWAASLATQPRRVWLGPNLVRWPVATLLAFVWLSVPLSTDATVSVYDALRLTAAAGLALYAANEVESLGELVPALIVAIMVQAVIGVGQVLDQADWGLKRFGEYHLNPNDNGVSIVWTADSPRLLRAYGLTDHPNILGGLMAIAAILLGAAMLQLRPMWWTLCGAVFAIGATALFLTFSRAAEVAFAGGLLCVFALLALRRDWSRATLWAGTCVAAVIIAGVFVKPYWPYLTARLNPEAQQAGSPEQRSLSERGALAKNTNTIFVNHPITGVGFGALPQAMRDEFPDFGYNFQPAHFALLVAAAETGLVGAMAYGALLVSPWVLLWFRRRRLTPEIIGVSGALLAVGLIGLFDYYPWSLAPGQVWAWLVLGLWVAAYGRMTGQGRRA
ncbi:MAG TPA: O-antigen ligase family protein [Dehalococcoidia bacterium]|jgi:hypothetical protein